MDLEDARRRLNEAGLYASVHPSGDRLVIAASTESREGITVLNDMTTVRVHGGVVRFERWTEAPWPGPGDGSYEVPGLPEAVAMALRWYFGEPVRMGEWLLPTHRHPDWEVGKLERAVLAARPLSPPEYERLRERASTERRALWAQARRCDRWAAPDWGEQMAVELCAVPHPSHPRRELILRRNLAEAFIFEHEEASAS